MRKKALLAIAFASGLVGTHMQQAIADSPKQTADGKKSALESLTKSEAGTPERRAYYLLTVAEQYLHGKQSVEIDQLYLHTTTLLESRHWQTKDWSDFLETWMRRCANKQKSVLLDWQAAKHVQTALTQAIKELNQTENQYPKLCMYFIACTLYNEMGDVVSVQSCNDALEVQLKSIEHKRLPTGEEVRAALAALDAQSYSHIPALPEGQKTNETAEKPVYSTSDFALCKQLKLRGLAIADKLPDSDHIRRKAHRDLALWYQKLGKIELAKEQKQYVFKLVDCNDEEILYPQFGTCGDLVWWQKERITRIERCGMG